MTYKNNFVAEVKCNGKILRIKDGSVHLPYGSEYTLLLKNLNSRKASVKVHVDGQDVLDYNSLILEPNTSSELEGFLSGTVAKNHFKFIHKTKQIQEHRGDKIDDGLIRIEFAFEKPTPEVIKKTIINEYHDHYHDHYHRRTRPYYHWNYNDCFVGDSNVRYASSGDQTSFTNSDGNALNKVLSSNSVRGINMVQHDSLGVESIGQPLDDEGITVKGSECYQSFRYGAIGELEEAQVITVQLKGIRGGGSQVQQPVTVSTKLQCPTCGIKSKSSFKYCPSCGTYLE